MVMMSSILQGMILQSFTRLKGAGWNGKAAAESSGRTRVPRGERDLLTVGPANQLLSHGRHSLRGRRIFRGAKGDTN